MTTTRDRDRIRTWLRRDAPLHLYELGDLDEFFWPHTTWFVGEDALALLYTPPQLAVLVAFAREAERPAMAALLASIRDELPAPLYAHLSPGLVGALAPRYVPASRDTYLRMVLGDRDRVRAVDTTAVAQLGPADRDELAAFYARAYPGNWFDPRMLETRQYFAIRIAGALAAVAGIHVYSASERVAALGNIATAPEHRRHGLAAKVTARLCESLLETVDAIGLNVSAANRAALACYERLGFVSVATFEEIALVRAALAEGHSR